jgi:integrase
MKVGDYYHVGEHWWIRLQEKGGKHHEMPVHHQLEAFINLYLRMTGPAGDKGIPLFRTCGRNDELSDRPMSRIDVCRMIKRRARNIGLDIDPCCHSFRATGITAYLNNGGTLENAQKMAAHKSPRTTKLYDRTDDKIMLQEIERVVI